MEPQSESLPKTEAVVDYFFDGIQEKRTVEESDAIQLFKLFGSMITRAANLVDTRAICRIEEISSSRFYFKVQGTRGTPYVCFLNFCSCSHFSRNCRKTPEATYCKHILACRLAVGLDKCRTYHVIEEDYVKMLGRDLKNSNIDSEP